MTNNHPMGIFEDYTGPDKSLKKLTNQQVFDKVAAHLLTQKRRAQVDSRCKYRAVLDNGEVLKCAAGCLIPDEEYTPNFEGKTVYGHISSEGGWSFEGAVQNVAFLFALQTIHDMHPPEEWLVEFATLAQKSFFGLPLDCSVLDQFK